MRSHFLSGAPTSVSRHIDAESSVSTLSAERATSNVQTAVGCTVTRLWVPNQRPPVDYTMQEMAVHMCRRLRTPHVVVHFLKDLMKAVRPLNTVRRKMACVGNEIQNESFGYAGYLLDDITRSTAAETEATSIAETEATSTARDGSDVDGDVHAKRCLIMYFECGTSII